MVVVKIDFFLSVFLALNGCVPILIVACWMPWLLYSFMLSCRCFVTIYFLGAVKLLYLSVVLIVMLLKFPSEECAFRTAID